MKQNKGFTAIELLIVMLAGVILIASGGKLASTLFDNAKVSSLEQNIQALRTTVRYLNEQTMNYAAVVATNQLIGGGAPEGLINPQRNKLLGPWNGEITVTGNSDTFTILAKGIPQNACLKLLTSARGSWVSVRGASGNAAGGTSITRTYTQPITTVNFCKSETMNTVEWVSR